MDLDEFRRLPIVGILRGGSDVAIEPIVESVVGAGLKAMEITMNTPGAPDLIRRAIETADGELTIGAGTVLDTGDLESALGAGAQFIVMPTLERNVVDACTQRSIPVFPGALTPQEIFDAWRAGATMVKVFPAKFFGPGYFKELKGPLGDIELLACGGVSAENLGDFFACGASAVAFGGSVFQPKWLSEGRFDRIGDAVRSLIESYQRRPA